MFHFLTAKITDRDNFAHDPEKSILYNMKKQYPTLYGGCLTLLYNMLLATIWYLQLYAMAKFQNNTTYSNTTKADLQTIFKVSDLKSYPMYQIKFRNFAPLRNDPTLCDGDCLIEVQKALFMQFWTMGRYKNGTWFSEHYPVRACTAEEIEGTYAASDKLVICGPYEKMKL